MSNATAVTPPDEHSLAWMDRLQDLLDGDLDAVAQATVQAHLDHCPTCQAQLAQFEALDQLLLTSTPRMSLDAAFDQRLLNEIAATDQDQRLRSRQRFEQEMHETRHALSRGLRQNLAFAVPGLVAGIALVFALFGWLEHSGMTQAVGIDSGTEAGRTVAMYLQALVVAVIGGGIGLTVARWLSSASD